MNEIIISIIMPIYNAEQHLVYSINSILNQTLKNFELILVNDGSKDKSLDICTRYAKLDNRIKIIDKKNEGVSIARNTGIDNSKGKYIMFCDADDYVEDNWCEEMLRIMIMNNNSLIISNYSIHNYRQDKIEKYINNILSKDEIIIYSKSNIMQLYKLGLTNSPWNKIYISQIIKDNNLKYDENLSLGEDLLFNLEYMKYIKDITVINKPLYNYILRDVESLDNKYYSNMFEICNKLYSELYNKMILFGVDIEKYREDYYNSYFNMLIKSLNNTFKKESKNSIIDKIKINTKILQSKEFDKCLSNVDLKNMNVIYKIIIKGKSSILLFIYTKMYNLKIKLIGKYKLNFK